MILYGTCYMIQVAWQHDIVQYSIWYTLNWHTVQYDTSVRVPDTWVQSWPDTWSRWTRWVSRQCPAPSPLLLTVCSGPSSVYRRHRSEGTDWRFRYLKIYLAMSARLLILFSMLYLSIQLIMFIELLNNCIWVFNRGCYRVRFFIWGSKR